MTKLGIMAATAALALTAGAANAAQWSIDSRVGPEYGLAINGNDTLADIGVIDGGGVLQAGRLNVLGANKTVEFFYLGSESGFVNRLTSGAGSHDETNTDPAQTVADALAGPADVTNGTDGAGLLDLSFSRDGGQGVITNATNPAASGSPGILFGYLAALQTGDYALVSYATDLVLFALDDGGAGPNFDFDDYVGVAHITPIPAAAFMLIPALAGLGIARRRAVKA